ncbi:hypothetical protein JCGZ_11995 [Jatropha curcas]|uniref:Uncharacterized protein n=1 Tax=Jatropha curcas TaxID=180498 RepID=A0A067KCK1_JATCU|nr:hypothetical protein JCGZ_11995 [Jatropha curcas]
MARIKVEKKSMAAATAQQQNHQTQSNSYLHLLAPQLWNRDDLKLATELVSQLLFEPAITCKENQLALESKVTLK